MSSLLVRPADNKQSHKAMLSHREFVAQKLNEYAERGLVPGDKSTGLRWEKAHFPKPECLGGTERVWLLHDDHMRQGILQSEEYGTVCFHSGDTYAWLSTFPSDAFELWEIAAKWASWRGVENARLSNAIQRELGVGFHDPEVASSAGRKGAAKSVEIQRKRGTGLFDPEVQAIGRQAARELGTNFTNSEVAKAAGQMGGPMAQEVHRANGTGFFSSEAQKRNSEKGASKGGVANGKSKWISLVTGHIGTGASVYWENRREGADTSAKQKLTPKQHDEIKDLTPLQRLLAIAMDDG